MRPQLIDMAKKLPDRYRVPLQRLYRYGRSVASRLSKNGAGYPSRFSVFPPPPEMASTEWPEPPPVERSGAAERNIYETGARTQRYDVELLESLNAEYRDKPIIKSPPSFAPASLAAAARRRLTNVHRVIGLDRKRVLEFGCGNGYEIWYLAHQFGSDAYGVDVVERFPWRALRSERVHFECVDLTRSNPYPEGFFNRIISFAVLEHVVHPYRALEELYRVLAKGGLAYLRVNLHRGPQASHLYRDLFFPWPHLLFTDEVIEEFYRRQGRPPRRAEWVNRLTWLHYQQYLEKIGFEIMMLNFDIVPIDEPFYRRFEDLLGRYPRSDLERDFFTVILKK